MWVRIISRRGDSDMVVLPAPAIRALGWNRGDYIYIRVVGDNRVELKRFDPVEVPDNVIDLATKNIEEVYD